MSARPYGSGGDWAAVIGSPSVSEEPASIEASAVQADPAETVVLAGEHLYLSTRREIAKKTWADVITVLNKKDATYVKTIDLKKDIVDMTVWGDRLVLATEDGAKYLALD